MDFLAADSSHQPFDERSAWISRHLMSSQRGGVQFLRVCVHRKHLCGDELLVHIDVLSFCLTGCASTTLRWVYWTGTVSVSPEIQRAAQGTLPLALMASSNLEYRDLARRVFFILLLA